MQHPIEPLETQSKARAVVSTQGRTSAQPYYSEGPGSSYGQEALDGSEGSGLMEYWRLLNRRKATWIGLALMGAVLGVLVALPQTPVYRARTSLEILSINEDFMNMKQTSPMTSNDSSYETSELQTQIKILQSDSLMKRVMAKLEGGQVTAKHTRAVPAAGWRKLLPTSETVHQTARERLVNQAARTLKVRASGRTRLIEATVDSTDAQLATDFANTLANQFIEQSLNARWRSTEKTSEWLGRELDDARGKLRHSEDALQAYARTSGLIFTSEDTNVSGEKLQQIQQELSAATANRIGKQARYELAQSSSPESLPDVLNDTSLRDAQAKITDLHRQIAQLSATYTPEYGKVKRAEAELGTLEAAFERDRAAVVNRIKNDYQEANRKETLLASAYDAQTREVTGQGEKSVQYNILKREADSNRQLYDTMLQQLKQSSIASAMHASNARVMDAADLPENPFSPNLRVNALVGLFSGLVLGIGLAIVRERADRTLQQPGDAQFWTNLPELGTVPSASAQTSARLPGKPSVKTKVLETSHSITAQLSRKKEPIELITWERKPSVMAEAFRSVLTSILFVGENGSRPRVLVFTSASPSDGKTTVVSNLAIAMAETRRRVLIVDADLRRPRMHDLFGVPNERGLSDLLREHPLSENALDGMIQQSKIPALFVLPSGPPTHAAANLLYSPNFGELLAKFKKDYDMVLVDTPPMLQMPDARIAGRLADAVILVARAERTTRDAMIAANQRFTEDRIRVLGTILNDWNPKRSASGYYGDYGKSHYSTEYASAASASSS